MIVRGLTESKLPDDDVAHLRERARVLRGAILTMTTLAASGHPGGSMSSLELYQVLYNCAVLRPHQPGWPGRDRVIVSHGHTSPGAYVTLADAGFFGLEDAVAHFRQAGSVFEGHVERSVPGIEWSSGNLGQGLSAGVGSALAARATGGGWHTYVAMSDGEQMKGQVAEARRLARKFGLVDLTAVVDLNRVQISGHTDQVMPVDVAADFRADGWDVCDVDGHDAAALYEALARARANLSRPCAILAHTVIGNGVSFMEDDPEFHGRGLSVEEYVRAMSELGLDPAWLDRARAARAGACETKEAAHQPLAVAALPGAPRNYTREKHTDCRSAWGTALADLARSNPATPMLVFDCDLMTSVKTGSFAAARPADFVECGVSEHNTATASGAASVNGVLAFWADFGVFGLDEVYNQQRLNDINGAGLKLALTHCGLDVGEDGKTHQCIDYIGSFRSMFGWNVIVPADPNQTDRAVRWAAMHAGAVAVAMGRSKLPVLVDAAGEPIFGGGYEFRYGAIEQVRDGGADVCVLCTGTVAGAAVDAVDLLRARGIDAAAAVVACPLDLDDEAMVRLARTKRLVTVEDHHVRSGLGCSVAEWLVEHGGAVPLTRIGVEGYQSSGASADILARAGLDRDAIVARIERDLERRSYRLDLGTVGHGRSGADRLEDAPIL